MNRFVRLSIASLLVGALATTAINWMAAWEEYYPSPGATKRWPFTDESEHPERYLSADFFDTSIVDRHFLMWAWQASTPHEWRVAPRIWGREHIAALRTNTEIHAECADGIGGEWRVSWRRGLGLTDSLVVHSYTFVPSQNGPQYPESAREMAEMYQADAAASERAAPKALEAHGIRPCSSFRSSAQWHLVRIPSWATLTSETPAHSTRLDLRPDWEDVDAPVRSALYAGGLTTEEVRAYGWPLRNMLVRGWRRDLEWRFHRGLSRDTYAPTREWWSDGLGDFPPLMRAHGAQLTLPATGLPWKPLWLPFLANALLLGAPLTLVGVSLRNGLGWCWRWMRRRSGDRCRRCGYSRIGIAHDTPCPECGKDVA